MTQKHSTWPVLVPLLLLAACNLPRTLSPPLVATLTPAIDPPPDYREGPVFSDFFVQDFQADLPTDWQLDPGWQHEEGLLWSNTDQAAFSIPGEWPDLTLFLRFRISPVTSMTISLNKSEFGVFRLALAPTTLDAIWEPSEGSATTAEADLALDETWHDLVLRLSGQTAEVFIDEVLYHELSDANDFPRTGLSITNTGSGLVEIARLDIAPPGMGPGLPNH